MSAGLEGKGLEGKGAERRSLERPGLSMLSLVRLDASLLARIERGERLLAVAVAATCTIVLGAGLYGVAFGLWRSEASALYSAIKLPALFLGVAALTTLASGLLAPVLRSRLSMKQTGIAILVSFAVTSAILGALAPISLFVVLTQTPMDPRAVGLAATDPLALPSIAIAQALVLFHTAMIAVAGTAGVVHLLGLLSRLDPRTSVVRRVVVVWIGLQFLVGSELAWIMRPFLGRPHMPVRFLSDEAFEGSFFEEVLLLARVAFGVGAPFVLLGFVVMVATWLFVALRPGAELVRVEVGERALSILSLASRSVPWAEVMGARAEGARVLVRLSADASLVEDTLEVNCVDDQSARSLAGSIEEARGRAREGPFRTLAVMPERDQ